MDDFQAPSDQDLENELNVMPLLAQYFGCEVEKTDDQFATYDFKLIQDGIHWGWVEYRRRRFASNKYKTTILSAHKFDEKNKLETYFCVEWDDVIAIKLLGMSWKRKAVPFRRGANHRPGDKTEPVVHMSTPSFTPLRYK